MVQDILGFNILKLKIRENMITPFAKILGCLALNVEVTIQGFNFELQHVRSVS